jgi:hypothetical protein
MRRILVIKLGALGDFVHAFPAFAAIHAHHAADYVTLLTTPSLRDLGGSRLGSMRCGSILAHPGGICRRSGGPRA